MSAVEKYRGAMIDALWGDNRYHIDPRRAVELADAAIAEMEAAIVVERNLVTSAHRAENAKQQALDAERHRADSAEAELHDFKSRHTAAGCGMDATTGSLHVMTTGAGYVNGAFCVNDVPNSFDHGEE